MSLSIIQNPLDDSDLFGVKSYKGPSISRKNGFDLNFAVKTPVSGHLLFHLVLDGILRRFSIFQEENQRNDYSVLAVNNTVFIVKNGKIMNETESSVSKRTSVIFASSGDTLWTVFNLRGGRGNHLKMHDEYEFSLEEFSQDFQSFQSGSFFVNEDNLRFFIKTPDPGILDFNLVADNIPIHFSVPEEGNQWNLYSVLFINGTICVTKNGNIITQIPSSVPEKIYVKFPSNDDTLWMVFNVCEDGGSRSCDIQCRACKKYEKSTELSQEIVKESSAKVHCSWKIMSTIATFISLRLY
jgi:hypothetical protein